MMSGKNQEGTKTRRHESTKARSQRGPVFLVPLCLCGKALAASVYPSPDPFAKMRHPHERAWSSLRMTGSACHVHRLAAGDALDDKGCALVNQYGHCTPASVRPCILRIVYIGVRDVADRFALGHEDRGSARSPRPATQARTVDGAPPLAGARIVQGRANGNDSRKGGNVGIQH